MLGDVHPLCRRVPAWDRAVDRTVTGGGYPPPPCLDVVSGRPQGCEVAAEVVDDALVEGAQAGKVLDGVSDKVV